MYIARDKIHSMGALLFLRSSSPKQIKCEVSLTDGSEGMGMYL